MRARARRRTYTRARCHWHGAILFSFSLCRAEGDEQSGIPIPLAGFWLSLPLSLPYRLGLTEPFLFVAVDGISSQLELDLSNPRVIALPARFSSFFPHAFLLTQNLSFYPVGGWAPRRVPRSFSLDVLNDVIEILTMNGKEYIYIIYIQYRL